MSLAASTPVSLPGIFTQIRKMKIESLDVLTCLRVDAEEALRVPAGDLEGELFPGPGVRVERFDLDDGDIFGRVLHDGWVIDGFRSLRSVVVDILDLNVHLNEGREWDHSAVSGVDCQPVVRCGLVIQQLVCPNHT